jgi:hypothetical protein
VIKKKRKKKKKSIKLIGPSALFFLKRYYSFRFFANQLTFFVRNVRCITEMDPFLPPLFDQFSVIFGLNTFRRFFCHFPAIFFIFFKIKTLIC